MTPCFAVGWVKLAPFSFGRDDGGVVAELFNLGNGERAQFCEKEEITRISQIHRRSGAGELIEIQLHAKSKGEEENKKMDDEMDCRHWMQEKRSGPTFHAGEVDFNTAKRMECERYAKAREWHPCMRTEVVRWKSAHLKSPGWLALSLPPFPNHHQIMIFHSSDDESPVVADRYTSNRPKRVRVVQI